MEPVAGQVCEESVPSDGGDRLTPEQMTGRWIGTVLVNPPSSDAEGSRPEEEEAPLPPPPTNFSPPTFSTS